MSHEKNHKVKLHHWQNGKLSMIEHHFESLLEATTFADNVTGFHGAKVYNECGELAHTRIHIDDAWKHETYA